MAEGASSKTKMDRPAPLPGSPDELLLHVELFVEDLISQYAPVFNLLPGLLGVSTVRDNAERIAGVAAIGVAVVAH